MSAAVLTRVHHRHRRVVEAWVDGELTGPQRDRVAAHLQECPDCAQHADLVRRISEAVRRCGRPATSVAERRLQHFVLRLVADDRR